MNCLWTVWWLVDVFSEYSIDDLVDVCSSRICLVDVTRFLSYIRRVSSMMPARHFVISIIPLKILFYWNKFSVRFVVTYVAI